MSASLCLPARTNEPKPREMMMTIPRQNVLLSWSSGKDSAWALHVVRQQPGLEVVGLLTTFNEAFDRVAIHAVRRELVEAQAVRGQSASRLGDAAVPLLERDLRGTHEGGDRRGEGFGCYSHCVRRPVPRRHPGVPGPAPGGDRRGAVVPDLDHRRGHARPGSSNAGCWYTGGPDLRGPEAVERAVRRSAVRREAPGGPAPECRSLWRTGRVSHVLLPLPRVQHRDPCDRRRYR